jgi:transposase-like protein
MSEYRNIFCPNQECTDFHKTGLGNIARRGSYGKNHDKPLLYCKTCGKRFAATHDTPLFGAHLSDHVIFQVIHHAVEGTSVRGTSRLLGISKEAVNHAILKVGEYCKTNFGMMMQSLRMTEEQLDELWSFVKKKRLLTTQNSKKDLERNGFGQP